LRKSWWIQNLVTTVAPSLQCLRCKGIGKFIFFWLCIVSFVKKNDGSVEKYRDFSVGLILMGDLPKWKTWKCFQYWSCEIHESDFRLMLWNTWKWFQLWFFFFVFFCEIHESDFNNGFVKYMKVISTFVFWNTWKWFQIGIVKYMKVISTMVLWNTWKWFQHWFFFLWNTWKWFQQCFCEIHESDFSNGFVNRPVCEIHESDFNNEFQGWWKNSKGSHTCMVEIWFVNRSQRWWNLIKKVLYLRLRSDLL
jgi:hypothetical protein